MTVFVISGELVLTRSAPAVTCTSSFVWPTSMSRVQRIVAPSVNFDFGVCGGLEAGCLNLDSIRAGRNPGLSGKLRLQMQ